MSVGEDDYPVGLRGLVTRGRFSGFEATIVEDRWQLDVDVEVFGRKVRIELARETFDRGGALVRAGASLETILDRAERAIVDALERETDRDLIGWWVARTRVERTDAQLADLVDAYAAHASSLEAAEAAAITDAIARLHADPEHPAHGAAAWLARRPTQMHADRARQAAHALKQRAEAAHRAVEAARYAHVLDGTAPIAVNAALEAEIEATPESRELYLVYADYLQVHGDPRGQLAMLLAGGDRMLAAAYRWLEPRQRYFLGGLPRDGEVIQLGWELGWIAQARVMLLREHKDAGMSLASILRTLLALPSSRFLQRLLLGAASVDDVGEDVELVTTLVEAGPRRTLRTLALLHDPEAEMLSWVQTGDLAPLWPLYPALTKLAIEAGSIHLGETFDGATLRDLSIQTCGLDDATLTTLCAASLDRLERLELWFGAVDRGATDSRGALRILEGNVAPQLRDLGLVNTEHTDELCAALVRSPRWQTLERLDLSHGTMTEVGAEILARALAAAPQLRRLEVSNNYLGDGALAALDREGLQVVSADQREAELRDGALFRYVGVIE